MPKELKGLNETERSQRLKFNEKHAETHTLIGKSIEHLKHRFPILTNLPDIPAMDVGNIARSLFVLHNILLSLGDCEGFTRGWLDDGVDLDEDEEEAGKQGRTSTSRPGGDAAKEMPAEEETQVGTQLRSTLVNRFSDSEERS
jgi:hypothetical protein